jgi:rare lipoprotein A
MLPAGGLQQQEIFEDTSSFTGRRYCVAVALSRALVTLACDKIATIKRNRMAVLGLLTSGHCSARILGSDFTPLEISSMRSIDWTRNSHRIDAVNRGLLGLPTLSSAPLWKVIRFFIVGIIVTGIAACAQSPVATNKPRLPAASRKASMVAVYTRTHTPLGTDGTSNGLASFYMADSRTASGEKFDPHELTAAHRTFPFGTRLRITSVATGRSVTVRINDRGPFVPGRVLDVSYSTADRLGILGRGVAKVKMEIVK